jgi:MOSC domain-containing protein YiiM
MAATKRTTKTARGRKQDRARVASGQKYEVSYDAKKTGRSAPAVKKAVKKVGNVRKKVEKRLTSGYGIEGDAHYGPFVRHRYLARRNPKAPNLRQVHLIPSELFDALRTSGFDVRSGDLGENITTIGLDLECLPLGTMLRLGASATLKLTGLRTPCVLIDRFKAGLKDRLHGGSHGPRFRAGVMAIVSEGGAVSPGDRIRAVLPAPPHLALPPL